MTDDKKIISLKRQAFDLYYKFLNTSQREAVYAINGPLLVLAGAGTGKTTVLVNRVAHTVKFGNAYYSDYVPECVSEADVDTLMNMEKVHPDILLSALEKFAVDTVPPYNILAITFTNKAAGEMKKRLTEMLGEDFSSMWVGTFHSVCARILRANADRLGYTSNFTIYDADDSKRLALECMRQLNIDEKMISVSTVLNTISRAKDNLLDALGFSAEAQSDFKNSRIAVIYELYEHKLRENNAMDFDDLIMQTVKLFREHHDVRMRYASRFRYISVDEYQDTNAAQYELVKLLSSEHFNIMAVGDDDQSIYKFRGASIKNILSFDRCFEDCRIIKLERNYRSTSNILSAANSVIRNNKSRRGKELYTESREGEKVHIKKLPTQNDEARYIVNVVRRGVEEGAKLSDYAVLYRMNAQANAIQMAFARAGIPFRVVGGRKFYDKKEIRDMLAYLTVINNPGDNLRLKRIVNEPKRKIGESTIKVLEEIAEEKQISLFEAMLRSGDTVVLSKSSAKLLKFTSLILELRSIVNTVPLAELMDRLLDLSGYRQMLLESDDEDDQERLENIEELKSSMVQYELSVDDSSLEGFLQSVSLITDVDNYDENANAVVMMTIHSAKGLEFPTVFLPGMEEGVFPGMQSLNDPAELEEERRLAYVAMTRAKDTLYLIHTTERMLYGRTSYNPVSVFVTEIDPAVTDAASPVRPPQPVAQPTKRKYPLSHETMKNSDVIVNLGKTRDYEIFVINDRVKHITFGAGTITNVTEMGADIMYEIVFDVHGRKRLMATYAKLTRE